MNFHNCIVLFLVIVLGLFKVALSSACEVRADVLNVRSSPSGTVLFQIRRGQSGVSRIGSSLTSSGGHQWAQISVNGRRGYVANQYLSCQVSNVPCSVHADVLNVRSSPSGGVLFQIRRGQSGVSRIGSSLTSSGGHQWAQISVNGRTGYVAYGSFITCGGSSPGGGGGGSSPGGSSGRCPNGSKLRDSLRMIHSSEGGCQNWSNDSGNKMNGHIGYTCAGIIPSVGYNNRNMFSYATSSCRNVASHMFVKCAWDVSNSQFKNVADKIYENNYAKTGGCVSMSQPAYYVCFDIAVNSGPGRSQQFIRELGGYTPHDPKGFATKLNEKHRAFYIAISQPGSKNAKFRSGWLARADKRKNYINSC